MDSVVVRTPFNPMGLLAVGLTLPITVLGALPIEGSPHALLLCTVIGGLPLLVLWHSLVERCHMVTVLPSQNVVCVRWRTFLFRQREQAFQLRSFVTVTSYLADRHPVPVNRLEFVTADARALCIVECGPRNASPFWSIATHWSEAERISKLRPLLAQRCHLKDSGFLGYQRPIKPL